MSLALHRSDPQHKDALERGIEHLHTMQEGAGYWEGEMVWNTMLLSQYVIVQKILGNEIEGDRLRLILKHYEVSQRYDGSFGMHGEGEGYVFMTALAYVAMRLLGVDAEDERVASARRWLKMRPGGVLAIPSWGKIWLSMIGLYEWSGVNPIPPELFLAPEWMPFHPNNYYCHTRYIYLGLGYLYGKRFVADIGSIKYALREELYDRPYERINFASARHELAASDTYVRPSWILRRTYDVLNLIEGTTTVMREEALAHCFSRLLYEQRASRYQGISPVNALLNTLAIFSYDKRHPELGRSIAAIESWKWQDEAEGIRYTGAHSTAWDTAFAMRAILSSPDRARSRTELLRAYAWLKQTQMREELPGHHHERREPILGGWCFSDGQHRWPVSDCTAEALMAILEMHKTGLAPEGSARIDDDRIEQAVTFILRRQNPDGGFGSYEARRAGGILELVNPSEMYGNCMTERSYTECTASCVGALARYREAYPNMYATLRKKVDRAIAKGVKLLKKRQRKDGSYAGFWGVNFTYSIFHVTEALRATGLAASDPAIARALDWLRSKQKTDGGWGEHWKSCLSDKYVEHQESQAAMTAWAVLALCEGDVRDPSVARGVAFLERLQQSDGSWPRQSQSGVFFQTAMLDYRLYKDTFPVWALARVRALGG